MEEKSSELLNQLLIQKDSQFKKFVSALLKHRYELNLMKGALKDKTLTIDETPKTLELKNRTEKQLESLIAEKKNMETERIKLEMDISQILQDKHNIEQEMKNLEDQKRDHDIAMKTSHKILKLKLKLYKKSLGCYLETEDSKPNIFTLYFFTQRKPSDNNWLVKVKLEDGNIELLQTIPELPRIDEMASHLAATRDMRGFLCCVYKNFCSLRSHTEELPATP